MPPFRFFAVAGLSIASSLAQNTITLGFDPKAIDKNVDPCNDFYQYACGNWMTNNPIPADQSVWTRFNELHERNQRILKDILETTSFNTKKGGVDQKVGDYYSSCMDEAAINKKGLDPIKAELDRIAELKDKKLLVDQIAHMHRTGLGGTFAVYSGQDFKNSTEVILNIDQGGIGLPDRDYYLKEDARSKEIRDKYVAHVQKMFELMKVPATKAAADAKTVMGFETALAKASLDRVARRDPQKLYHRMSVKELIQIAPDFDWPKYIKEIGTSVDSLNVAVPDFYKQLAAQIKNVSLEDWKTYLTWHLVHSTAPLMSTKFVDENFEFFGRTLTGQKEQRPRWKRCVQYTDGDLGEALGQKYVDLTFGKEGKDRTLRMVNALEKALQADIQKLDWMTPETKKKALEKLHAITNKIGYPEKWRDYSALQIKPVEAIGNSHRANVFEFKRQMDKIGKPVDEKEWFMTPPTVNAYYDPQMNNINFPAGILQPPFYDNKLDDAVNFGGIGAVIGHELTHGFDDQGSQFDAKGNLENWWSEKDAKEFAERTECLVKQYAGYVATGDVKLNGKLTLGENTADNGGLRIAHMALIDTIAGKTIPKIDGYAPEQRLFLGWGQIWCQNATDEAARLRAQTDPHSPGRWRVNGVVSNMPEFQNAFACKVGQPMVRQPACHVW